MQVTPKERKVKIPKMINCIDCGELIESKAGNHKRCNNCGIVHDKSKALAEYEVKIAKEGKTRKKLSSPSVVVLRNGVECLPGAFAFEIAGYVRRNR